jgi:hypothetical protein
MFEPSIVGSQMRGIGSGGVMTFGHMAGCEVLEVGKSGKVVVEQSNVMLPTEEKCNDVGLAASRTARPGGCANNPAPEDGEVGGGSALVRVPQPVSPDPLRGVVNGWAGSVARSHQPVVGPCPPRLQGSPSSH